MDVGLGAAGKRPEPVLLLQPQICAFLGTALFCSLCCSERAVQGFVVFWVAVNVEGNSRGCEVLQCFEISALPYPHVQWSVLNYCKSARASKVQHPRGQHQVKQKGLAESVA